MKQLKKRVVRRMTGVVYKVYFDFDEGIEEALKQHKLLSCIVIADHLEDAIAKVKACWPNRLINSVFTEHSFNDKARADIVLH